MTGGTARGPFAVDTGRALEALRLEWAAEYDAGFADGAYRAARIDGTGDPADRADAGRTGRCDSGRLGRAGHAVSGPYVLESGADLDRLRWYRAERPDVLIGGGEFGTWVAIIPEVTER